MLLVCNLRAHLPRPAVKRLFPDPSASMNRLAAAVATLSMTLAAAPAHAQQSAITENDAGAKERAVEVEPQDPAARGGVQSAWPGLHRREQLHRGRRRHSAQPYPLSGLADAARDAGNEVLRTSHSQAPDRGTSLVRLRNWPEMQAFPQRVRWQELDKRS